MNLTKQEIELAIKLLDLASDEFSNHGCNDFDFPEHWTQEECDTIGKAICEDEEDYGEEIRSTNDWSAMDYIVKRLKEQIA